MRQVWWVIGLMLLGVTDCSRRPPSSQRPAPITLATTTSTQDSGLLDVLIPLFREQSGIEVKVVAVGSGQALELGRRGDADVLLVHSPAAEEAFVRDGMSLERMPVMANDFVLVGPAADSAQVRGRTSITDAFREIARRQAPFVSRSRPVRNPPKGEGGLEGVRDATGRGLVSEGGDGHGTGSPAGERETSLHSLRPWDIPGSPGQARSDRRLRG